jgi:hypothetical protein
MQLAARGRKLSANRVLRTTRLTVLTRALTPDPFYVMLLGL